MQRRQFLRSALSLPLMFPVLGLLTACAPRISQLVHDPANGEPWRCAHCGHLTRSSTDISGDRCPRCGRRHLSRISEEELAARLARAQ